MILALARPDPKKNITTLVKAFGECRHLRELANLVCLVTELDVFGGEIILNSAQLNFLYCFRSSHSVFFPPFPFPSPLFILQTLIMGNRDGIDEMSSTNASVLLSVLKLIDKHDLYGQVAYPKHHKQADVPDIYRLAAKTKVRHVPCSMHFFCFLSIVW